MERSLLPGRPRLALAFVALAVGILSVWEFGLATEPPAPEPPALPASLFVAPEQLALGEVWEDDRVVRTIVVENLGAEAAAIDDFDCSCRCTAVEPRAFVLAPGERRSVRITLNLGELTTGSAEGGAFEVSLQAVVRGRRGPAWTFQGRTRKALCVDATGVAFGEHSELGPPPPPRTLTVTAVLPLRSLDAAVDSVWFRARVEPSCEQDGYRFRVVVEPVGSLPLDTYRAAVTLRARLADGQKVPPRSVPVTARVVRDVQGSPAESLLGAHPVGATATESIALRSLTGRPFTVERVEAEGGDTNVSRSDDSSYTLHQKIERTGDHRRTVRFLVATTDRPPYFVPVDVRYHGLPR